ncbi:MAG TPA: Obg family GTPase CgtA, partial [Bacillota bacterium]
VDLELKLLADVGLIGFPNAGKSTLLSRISAARPKVADYPFTTLIPNLGVVNVKGQSFVAVDIPGLIEGAHSGAGLGDQFLRHIERTRLLVHLVDVSGISGRDPYQDYLQINEELRLFDPELATRIQIVVANKVDLPDSKSILESFIARIGDCRVIPISAATGEGVSDLLDRVLYLLTQIPKESSQLIVSEPEIDTESLAIQVLKIESGFMVQNDGLLRRMARFDLNNEESLRSLQRLLKRWGVIQALIDAGVQEGDMVRIGDFEFTYLSEE